MEALSQVESEADAKLEKVRDTFVTLIESILTETALKYNELSEPYKW